PLDVAGAEVHVEVDPRIGGDLVDQIDHFALRAREPRRLGMALRIADVPADVERSQPAIRLAADRQLEIRRLARTFLAVAIERERFVERRDEIGPPPPDLIVDRYGARDAAPPAGFRPAGDEEGR